MSALHLRPPDLDNPDAWLRLFSPLELAKLWGVSDDTILRMVKAGELHGTRVGTKWRISDLAVRWYLAQHDPTPTAAVVYLADYRRGTRSA